QIMRLSFRVVLAVVAALTASIADSADSECHTADGLCTTNHDCCRGYICMPIALPERDEVSMSSFIQDLWTHRLGRD
ncbi:uncharacterized protein F5147DRAFT_728897, partial [Suillus discolor]